MIIKITTLFLFCIFKISAMKINHEIHNASQKNFKKICFGFVDDKIYEFEESLLGSIECAGYVLKILRHLKKTDKTLLENLFSLSSCICSKNNCISCINIQKKLHKSKNRAIKALYEIQYEKNFILIKKNPLSQTNKKLIKDLIEILSTE